MAGSLAERTQRLEQQSERLRASEQRLDTLANQAPVLLWFNGPQGCEYVNQAYLDFLGVGDVDVRAFEWAQFIHPEDRDGYVSAYQAAFAAAARFEAEFRFRRHDGEYRWMRSVGIPRRDPAGSLAGYVGTTFDITERRETEEQLRLLAREVDHRGKNLLAVVQSLLQLSRADDIRTYVNLVQGRVMALARAHSLLSEGRWEGGDLRRLVEEELAPYRVGGEAARATASGPSLLLSPAATQSLALALHELATNAAKYGALSRPAGRVAVEWQRAGGGLALAWTETGGPRVAQPPSRKGFGGTVITASIEQQLQGQVTLAWLPEGLHATMWIPATHLAHTEAPVPPSAPEPPPRADKVSLRPTGAHRILVAEDEPVLTMGMQVVLGEAGFAIVGPAATLEQALALASSETFDAAVIDYNLAGAPSDPLANLLRSRGIPFALVTGYAPSGLPAALADVPCIVKPFDPVIVIDLLIELLGRRQSKRQAS